MGGWVGALQVPFDTYFGDYFPLNLNLGEVSCLLEDKILEPLKEKASKIMKSNC